MLGPPDTVVELGETEVSEEIFMDYLSSLGESTYRSSSCHPSPLLSSLPHTGNLVVVYVLKMTSQSRQTRVEMTRINNPSNHQDFMLLTAWSRCMKAVI